MTRPVYLITGASGALGAAVVSRLAADGAALALVAGARPLPTGVPADALQLVGVDLTDPAEAERAVGQAVAHWGGVDGIVNVAGTFRWEPVEKGALATWEALFRINLATAFNVSRAGLPALRARGGGRIVNIGAASADRAHAGMGAYAASKAGVLRLTEAMADECKDQLITVNAVLPSIIDTPANRLDMPTADHSRWVAPSDIAEVIAFLLGPAARAITGATIPVTGRT